MSSGNEGVLRVGQSWSHRLWILNFQENSLFASQPLPLLRALLRDGQSHIPSDTAGERKGDFLDEAYLSLQSRENIYFLTIDKVT